MLTRPAWLLPAMLLLVSAVHAQQAQVQRDGELQSFELPQQIVKILRTSNKAQTTSYVPVVFEMYRNNPFNVIRFLHRAIQPEEGLLHTFANPDGTGGKVLFVVPPHMVESLGELVASLDRPGLNTSSGDVRIYQQLKHRRCHESDLSFLTVAASYSTQNGTITICDPETNALYYEDAPSAAEAAVTALINYLDVPTPMVQLNVRIYELDARNDADIGLDYIAWKNGPGANLFALGAFAEAGNVGNLDVLPGGLVPAPTYNPALGLPGQRLRAHGYNAASQYAVSSAFFDFLQVKGKARLLNEARLAALSTYPARLTAGDQVLYYHVENDPAGGVRATGEVFGQNDTRTVTPTTLRPNLSPVETGIVLEFVPTIGRASLELDTLLEWSDYSGFDDAGIPQINRRRFETKLRMAVGEEVVMGGFRRQVRVRARAGVPYLSRIPVLGYLFGREQERNQDTEVVVVLQPVTIFDYNVAGGYGIAPADQLVVDQVTGAAPLQTPNVQPGFEMIGLDPARLTPVEPIR